jgi:ATP-binding cassette subfamily E protein 1
MKRIAIIDQNKCKPDKCSKECIRSCPPQKSGKQVIEIIDIEDISKPKKELLGITDKKKVAKIFESMCIGCNQCVKRCPFNAIKIINLPQENPEHIVHRYSMNGFRLYKLPILKTNTITGIIGENGVGKTTLIDILSNKMKPNFELFDRLHSDKEIINKFRGSVLQSYLTKLYSGKLTFSIKEQKIKKGINPKDNILVKEFLQLKGVDIDLMDMLPESFYLLEINKLVDLCLQTLSGGELQRLLCWVTAISNADVYIFDEPSNFLDIKQRLEIAKLIKSIQSEGKYILLIEHDLSMLDYVSDELFIVYGKPGAYGIVSSNLTTLDGINMYLDGYITTDNVRFREEVFDLKPPTEIALTEGLSINTIENEWSYEGHEIEYPNYKLIIPEGKIKLSNSICVILGENGTGKTTFIIG